MTLVLDLVVVLGFYEGEAVTPVTPKGLYG